MVDQGKLKLNNGMEVYWASVPDKKYVNGTLEICSGSAAEPHDKRGLAHMVEHMTFHGSKGYRSRAKQYAKAAELTWEPNASTHFSTVSYPFSVESQNLTPVLTFLKDLVYHPIFTSTDLAHERKIIADECRIRSDQIQNKANAFFLQSFFRGTPLEETIIGREDHIEGITREDVADFHRTHFHAANTRLYLYGGLSDNLEVDLNSALGDVVTRKPFPKFQLSLPLLLNNQVTEHSLQGLRECYGDIAFRAPNFVQEDSPTMCVIQRLLAGNGRFGLMERIRHGLGLTYNVSPLYQRGEMGSSFDVNFSCGPRDLDQTRDEIGRILATIDPSQRELELAKQALLREYKTNQDSPQFRFNQFVVEATTEFSYARDVERTAAVTRKQVRDVVDRYFVKQPSQTILTVPAK